MNNQIGPGFNDLPLQWGFQCHANGCEETFLNFEELTHHLFTQEGKTHRVYLDQFEGLQAKMPDALRSLNLRAKVAVVLWQGRCIKKVDFEKFLQKADPSSNAAGSQKEESEGARKTANALSKSDSSKRKEFPRNYSCTFPGCVHIDSDSSNALRHKRTHQTESVRAYRCLAQECDYISSQTNNLIRHITRTQKDERKNGTHRVFFQNNQRAIENGSSQERKDFIAMAKCMAIRVGSSFELCPSDQEHKLDTKQPEPSEKSGKKNQIPQNIREPVVQEKIDQPAQIPEESFTAWATDSDYRNLSCYSPIAPSTYEEKQELQPVLTALQSALRSDVPADEALTDSLPSFIEEEYPQYQNDYLLNSFELVTPDSLDQDLFLFDQEVADIRVHTSIDPDLIMLTPHVKRKATLDPPDTVKRQRKEYVN